MQAGSLPLLLIRVIFKAKLKPSFLLLLVHDDIVLGQRDRVLKHEHKTFGLFANFMILAIVNPQFFGAFKNLKLRQVVDLARDLPHAGALLATHITKVVVLPIVHIQLLIIIEMFFRAKPADSVRLFYMSLQGRILIERLLEQKHRLMVKT